MENKKQEVETGQFGKPKENAWHWLFYNRGVVIIFWFILPIGMIYLWGQSTLGFIFFTVLTILIPCICLINDIPWYKQLVKNNSVKSFKDSKFYSKYLDQIKPLVVFKRNNILYAVPTICIILDYKWYKELVKDNLIKSFKNSKLFSKI